MLLAIGPFRYLEEQRVLVCVDCRFCYVSDGADAHLAATSHKVPAVQRADMVAAIQQLPGILRTQSDLAESFRFPPPNRAANPLLEKPVDGALACRACRFACFEEKWMKDHCRTAHGWVNQRPRGRISPKAIRQVEEGWSGMPWRTGVRCQRFFRTRAASGWFEVDGTMEADAEAEVETRAAARRGNNHDDGPDDDDNNNTGWQSVVKDHLAAVRAEREMAQRTVDGRTGIDHESSWVRRVGSAKHLAGKNLLELWEASAGPVSRSAREKMRDRQAREQQEKMARVADGFDREVSRCKRRLELVPDEALAWLGGIEADRQGNKAFGWTQNASTMAKYAAHWKGYLCYCVRACRLGREEARKRWGVCFDDA
ncbi:hypothetical protein V8C42DRAFT_364386, partial [Trichoderma barbatum]